MYNTKQIVDLLIIGAGPIGLACGIKAQEAGLTHLIIEKGCLVNSLFNYPKNMTFFSTSERLEIGDVPFVSTQPKPRRDEALEYYRRICEKFELQTHLFETVLSVQKLESHSEDLFLITTTENEYLAKNVVVATGFYDIPALLDIPGEELTKVTHYYDEPHYYSNQKVIVIGASNSAIDAALETYRKGADVTLVIRGGSLGPRVKYWVRPDIENRIAEGSIRAYFNSHLKSIHHKHVVVNTPEGEVDLPNDFVIALTGYRPDFAFIEKMGIKLLDPKDKVPFHNPGTMETNIAGLYLAGVVCGGVNTHLWFIENSRIHADRIVNHILANRPASGI